ncbi:MAG TPA: hypothetical protein VF170_14415, partial [Planctomycetaceae bacterium]
MRPSSRFRLPVPPFRVRLLGQTVTLAVLASAAMFRMAFFTPAPLLAQEKPAVAEKAEGAKGDEAAKKEK